MEEVVASVLIRSCAKQKRGHTDPEACQARFYLWYLCYWMNYQTIYHPSKLQHHEEANFHFSSKHLITGLPLIKTQNLNVGRDRVE